MLTRLKITGFKNLVDVDVRFGPFTCIAGTNGVGKSNLFDAIRFLSALANHTFTQAAQLVREGKTADIRGLFHRTGNLIDDRMSFEAEMIIPFEGEDDLGQRAQASITFLRYTLELAHRTDDGHLNLGGLELRKEELTHINIGDSKKHLPFEPSRGWRESVIKGRQVSPLISTVPAGEPDRVLIKLHQNRGSNDGGGGKPTTHLASRLPRTVLSVANAAEHKTAFLVRREMESWKLLQLEPSAMREPDDFMDPPHLGTNGSHLAATLYRLGRSFGDHDPDGNGHKNNFEKLDVYAKIANRLSELIEDVREVEIDRDSKRELLTLIVKNRDGTAHPARALSDGTLRFLALAVLELDPTDQGVICLEEPENGIHPARIPAMLQLLQDIATDTDEKIGPDNPLRQVIVNTHSPALSQQVPDNALIYADLKETLRSGHRFRQATFACVEGTWRDTRGKTDDPVNVITPGDLLPYFHPVIESFQKPSNLKPKRVIDRPDLHPMLPLSDDPQWR